MKLIINRNQKEQKGLLGGHKGMSFLLNCKVELTAEENELIKKYKAEEQPLAYSTGEYGGQVPSLKIGDLVRGIQYEMNDIRTLINNENVIKQACEEFKILLLVMASFGGDEIIEF